MVKTTPQAAESVLEYLRQKFDWAEPHETASGALGVRVGEGACRWHVTVSEEFLQGHEPRSARGLLEDWNLAGEMRRAEGLGISVSSAGVRLESSN
jgi:hypothetical protein